MVALIRRRNVHFPSSDLWPSIAPDGERRPQPFLRRPHGRHAGACGRHVAATLRPRSRAGGFPSSCDTLSIHRHRWCAGRCAARQRPEWLQSFGTITLVLAMPLQLAPSTNQVQLTPHARLAHPSGGRGRGVGGGGSRGQNGSIWPGALFFARVLRRFCVFMCCVCNTVLLGRLGVSRSARNIFYDFTGRLATE